ncbi:SAM-dependent methyltransferase [Microbacterium sp.]|uniref:SAM-dependent methyltransferase n=1 Tax=Microbacterium sp. TaxID=51671 RepID=UPI003C76A29B
MAIAQNASSSLLSAARLDTSSGPHAEVNRTMAALSPRLSGIVDALPLRSGMRVLEIGGAPGAAAKVIAHRLGNGHVLVIDRSAKGVAQIERNAAAEIAAGLLSVRQVAAEDFELLPDEEPFELAFAIRVGALDGRHPRAGLAAKQRIAKALTPTGRLFIDGGDPLQELELR